MSEQKRSIVPVLIIGIGIGALILMVLAAAGGLFIVKSFSRSTMQGLSKTTVAPMRGMVQDFEHLDPERRDAIDDAMDDYLLEIDESDPDSADMQAVSLVLGGQFAERLRRFLQLEATVHVLYTPADERDAQLLLLSQIWDGYIAASFSDEQASRLEHAARALYNHHFAAVAAAERHDQSTARYDMSFTELTVTREQYESFAAVWRDVAAAAELPPADGYADYAKGFRQALLDVERVAQDYRDGEPPEIELPETFGPFLDEDGRIISEDTTPPTDTAPATNLPD